MFWEQRSAAGSPGGTAASTARKSSGGWQRARGYKQKCGAKFERSTARNPHAAWPGFCDHAPPVNDHQPRRQEHAQLHPAHGHAKVKRPVSPQQSCIARDCLLFLSASFAASGALALQTRFAKTNARHVQLSQFSAHMPLVAVLSLWYGWPAWYIRFVPKATPTHLRWPQKVVDTLVPTYVAHTTSDKVAPTLPLPPATPGPYYGDDPLMADFLRARAVREIRPNSAPFPRRSRAAKPPPTSSSSSSLVCACAASPLLLLAMTPSSSSAANPAPYCGPAASQ